MGKTGEDADEDLDPVSLKPEESKRESLVIEEHLSKLQLEDIYKIFENSPR